MLIEVCVSIDTDVAGTIVGDAAVFMTANTIAVAAIALFNAMFDIKFLRM